MAHTETPTDSERPEDDSRWAAEFADRFIDEHSELFETLANE